MPPINVIRAPVNTTGAFFVSPDYSRSSSYRGRHFSLPTLLMLIQ